MPAAVAGNAVADIKGGLEIFSLMGVGPRKTWDDVTNKIYSMDLGHPRWIEGRPVPGLVGRLNASAAGAKGLIVLMGGFMVEKDGNEITVPDVNIYEPGARRWSRGKDIPTPVDSAAVGVTHDRFVYLIDVYKRQADITAGVSTAMASPFFVVDAGTLRGIVFRQSIL